jgi:hypothetical protein
MTHSIDTLPPSSAKSPESLWADGDGGRGSAVDNTYLDVGGAQSADQFKKDAVRLDQMSNAEKVRVQINHPLPSHATPLKWSYGDCPCLFRRTSAFVSLWNLVPNVSKVVAVASSKRQDACSVPARERERER